MTSIEDYIKLRRLVDVLYDVQDVRMRTANRLRLMPKEAKQVHVRALTDMEQNLTKQIDVLLQDISIYTQFLQRIRGIGPRISGSIIAQTMIRFERLSEDEYKKARKNLEEPMDLRFSGDQLNLAQKTEKGNYLVPTRRGIEAFDTISKYWAWWGLHVIDGSAAKRKRGENINWNSKMRTLAWKIGKQFVIQGLGYRVIYDQEKDRLTYLRMPIGKCPKYQECKSKLKRRSEPACKGHIDAMARRKAVKLFVSHLWVIWRRIEGLPVTDPYVIERLGHKTKIDPIEE